MYLRTVRGEHREPSLSSNSLAIRSSPHNRFSLATRRTSCRSSRGIGGQPGRNLQRQNSRDPARCQRSTVSGRTATRQERQSHNCDSKATLARVAASMRRGFMPRSKGPFAELIAAIIELKQRNPQFGCVRIALQIAHAFGIEIDKDVVRRVLAKHYRPGDAGTTGPSWLTLIAQAKDCLWSIDLFRCESILLHSH